MVIQHNISALNSHRNLGINNSATAKNLEKLSSGYRINRAGDDAAGLAISEKMRGQIRGLAMAEQNTENGISLIQTAEGGLNETHAILQRMRELSVQASNGTYQDDDRKQIAIEVQALKDEIDRIASSTHYNGIKLLNGTLGGTASISAKSADTDIYADGSVAAIAKLFGELGFGVSTNDTTGAVTGSIILTSYTTDFKGESASFVISTNDAGTPKVSLQIGDRTYVGEFSAAGLTATDVWTDGDGNVKTGTVVSTNSYIFRDEDGNVVAALQTGAALTGGKGSGAVTGVEVKAYGTADTLIDNTNATTAITSTHSLYNAMIGNDKSELIFQIGANGGADQRVGLNVQNMSTAHLGLTGAGEDRIVDISIATRDEANDAIKVIDAATNQVSAQRASLGALQNRLEHTLNNLGVTKENLTAAESTIRDVDMAKEMMEFTKNNILVQASQAMLAQANALPQGILSLLS